MSYRSPVADILFSLKAVAGLPEMIQSRLDGDFDWETIGSVVAEAGRFATDEIAPLNRSGDIAGVRYENGVVTMPKGYGDVYRRWAEAGWGGVSASRGIRRHGASPSGQRRVLRNLERRVDGLRALPAPDRQRHRRPEDIRLSRVARPLRPEHGRRPLDRDDEPDRAAGRIRSRHGQNPRGKSGRRNLSPVRPENLHHLWRTRHGREHRPSGARKATRRPGGNARAFALPRAKIPRQRRRLAWAPQ